MPCTSLQRCCKHAPLILEIEYRWEGNPSSNIRILNNTVVQCPYGPGVCYPAISVYAGGDDQESSGSVMHDVEVRGNLVIGSLVWPAVVLCLLSSTSHLLLQTSTRSDARPSLTEPHARLHALAPSCASEGHEQHVQHPAGQCQHVRRMGML